jgi:hypothetical protein
MRIRKIIDLSKNLIVRPVHSWKIISEDHLSRKKVILDYLLPMSLMIGFCSLLGTLFFTGIEDSFSFGYVVLNGLISFLIIFLEVYLSAWLIWEIAISFSSSSNSNRIFNLVVFSHAPFFIILALYKLFPALLFFLILGIYSFYLFWLGYDIYSGIDKEKKIVFVILSGFVMILTFLLVSVIFDSVYEVLLQQFTTFGS